MSLLLTEFDEIFYSILLGCLVFIVSVLLTKEKKTTMASYSRITSRIMSKYFVLNSGDQTSINQNQCSSKSQTDADNQENVDKNDVRSQSV